MTAPEAEATPATARLGLWDAVSIIIGIVIGATIYETPWLVFGNVAGPWEGLLAWGLGGALTFVGALCYAELATAYPRSGGDYVYLSRAYGDPFGFLFGWAQLATLLAGSIGMMAYIFANYAAHLFGWGGGAELLLAAGSVALLAVVNMRGVVAGKTTQNLLTLIKVVGLAAIVLAGLFADAPVTPVTASPEGGSHLGFAMIFVLLAYGGWNDIAFVAADVRDPRRNLPRALLLGSAAIVGIYLLVNAAYLAGLGFEGVRASRTPAADTLGLVFGEWGSRTMSAMVMIAALGAVNALTFVASRVTASLGADHALFARLGRWHPRLGAPVAAIGVQAAICLAMIAMAGSEAGLRAVNAFLTGLGFEAVETLGKGGFDVLLKCTAPVFWAFFLLTGGSLFVLRWREPQVQRPFPVPFYPLLPLIFCGMCGYMLHASVTYAGTLTLLGVVPVLLGLPLYAWSRRMARGAG